MQIFKKYQWLLLSIYSIGALGLYLFLVPFDGVEKNVDTCVVATFICVTIAWVSYFKHSTTNTRK